MQRTFFQRASALSAILAIVVFHACKGGDGGTTPSGDFSLSVTPASGSGQSGSTAGGTVSINRSGNFTGAVSLRLDNPPSGFSAAFLPLVVPMSGSTSSLIVSIASTVATGNYTLTIVGSASGQADRRASFSIAVTQPTGSFSLSASPAALSIQQGQNKTAAVAITRTPPFTGSVTLGMSGAPAGVTASFSPASIATDQVSSTLTLAVAGAVAPGQYALTVNGTGDGVAPQSFALSLTVTADPGRFALTANPANVSVQQGQSIPTTVTIARTAPFASAVNLAVASIVPATAGITATFTPATVAAGATTSSVSIAVGAAVAPGAYQLTVVGTGTGVPDASVVLSLNVTPSPGGFVIAPAAATVRAGRVVTADIAVSRTPPFVGAITLTVEGLPAGITASFAQTVVPAGQTSVPVTYTVLATVPVAAYNIAIRGTAPGVSEQAATQNVTVTAAPAGNVNFQFCNPLAVPVWVGYQNGNEPWTQVVANNGTYSIPISADKGGVAFVTPVNATGGAGYDVLLVLGTQGELIDGGNQSCAMTPPTKTLFGTVAGQANNEVVTVNIGSGYTQLMPLQGTAFQVPDAGLGLKDLFATRTTFVGPPTANKVIVRRQTNYPAGSTIPVLNFESAEAAAATLQTATAANAGTDVLTLRQTYITNGGTTGEFPSYQMATTVASYMVMPPAVVQAGDLYNVRIDARLAQGVPATRTVTSTFTTPTPQALVLGPMLQVPTMFALQAAPFYQVRLQTTLQPEYNKAYSGRYQQPTRTGMFYATAGYLGNSVVDLTTPDLTAVPGWKAEWGPIAGVSTQLTASAFGWSGTSRTLFPGWFGDVVVEPGVVLRSGLLRTVTSP